MFLSFDKRGKKIYEKLEDQTPIILITERIFISILSLWKVRTKMYKISGHKPMELLMNIVHWWQRTTPSREVKVLEFCTIFHGQSFCVFAVQEGCTAMPQTVRNGLNPKSFFNTISTAKSYRRKQTPAQIQVQKNTYKHKMGDSGDIQGPRFPLMYCPEKYRPLIFNASSTLGCCCLFLSSVALVKTWLLYKILWEYSGELSFDVSSTVRKNYCIYASIMVKPTWKCPGTYRNNLFCSS